MTEFNPSPDPVNPNIAPTKNVDLEALGIALRDLDIFDGCADYLVREDRQSMGFWPEMESDERYDFFADGRWINSSRTFYPTDVSIIDAWRSALVRAGLAPEIGGAE